MPHHSPPCSNGLIPQTEPHPVYPVGQTPFAVAIIYEFTQDFSLFIARQQEKRCTCKTSRVLPFPAIASEISAQISMGSVIWSIL